MTDKIPHLKKPKSGATSGKGANSPVQGPPADQTEPRDDEFTQGMLGPEDFPGHTGADENAGQFGDDLRHSDPTRNDGDPHKVGYARPPVEFRFQPGVSGNPRGRKPTPVPFGLGQALVEGGQKTERVRVGSEIVELTREQILAESLWTESINGKVKDKAKLIEILQRCGAYRVEDEVTRIREAEIERQGNQGLTKEMEDLLESSAVEFLEEAKEWERLQKAAEKCTCLAFQEYRDVPVEHDDAGSDGDTP